MGKDGGGEDGGKDGGANAETPREPEDPLGVKRALVWVDLNYSSGFSATAATCGGGGGGIAASSSAVGSST